jgi:hypothetical protein
VELWKQHDLLRFQERFLAAHEAFCDSQESILYTLNDGLKPGQVPTRLLATLNANRPLKWRPTVKVDVDVPNELIQQIRKLQQLGSQAALEDGDSRDRIIDGDSKPLPWE